MDDVKKHMIKNPKFEQETLKALYLHNKGSSLIDMLTSFVPIDITDSQH